MSAILLALGEADASIKAESAKIPLLAEFDGGLTGYFHASHKMTYGDLSSALLENVSATLSLGTMA